MYIFGEMSVTGYPLKDELRDHAETTKGESFKKLKKLAKEHNAYIVVGLPTKDEKVKGLIYNSAAMFHPNGKVDVYNKWFLITFGPFDTKEKILSQLLGYVLQRVKIRRVFVDRGFFDSKAIKVFNRFHLKYLMPATMIPTVKNVMEIAPAPSVIMDFEMKDVAFNLVIVEELENDKKVKRAFATNEEYDENDVDLAQRLFLLYGRRWGVETSYRVKKHSYLPKTTSKNYLIRLFYFMFSVLLYNLWIFS